MHKRWKEAGYVYLLVVRWQHVEMELDNWLISFIIYRFLFFFLFSIQLGTRTYSPLNTDPSDSKNLIDIQHSHSSCNNLLFTVKVLRILCSFTRFPLIFGGAALSSGSATSISELFPVQYALGGCRTRSSCSGTAPQPSLEYASAYQLHF